MDKPDISIIVPVKNEEKGLPRCIDSVLSQKTTHSYELILVCGKSLDSSQRICESYSRAHSNIVTICQKGKGLSGARNDGFKIARGDTIFFVDADDYLLEGYLEEMFLSGDDTMRCCSFTSDEEKIASRFPHKKELTKEKEIFSNICVSTACGGYVWNKSFDRKILLSNQIVFDENAFGAEDLLFVVDYLLASPKMRLISQPLYFYCSPYLQDRDKAKSDVLAQQWLVTDLLVEKKLASHHLRSRDLSRDIVFLTQRILCLFALKKPLAYCHENKQVIRQIWLKHLFRSKYRFFDFAKISLFLISRSFYYRLIRR